MKTCPYCSEEIQDTAKKCRYCGEWIKDEHQTEESYQFFKHKNLIVGKVFIGILGIIFVILCFQTVYHFYYPGESFKQKLWRVEYFLTNQKNGYGIIKTGSYQYLGFVKNGMRNGYGVNEYITGEYLGDRYEGYYIDGSKNGYGIYYFLNGGTYSGERKDDERHGYGVQIYKGTIYTGERKFGKKNGYGEELYREGDVYKGNRENNTWSGNGIRFKTNGIIISGKFQDGKIKEGLIKDSCGERICNEIACISSCDWSKNILPALLGTTNTTKGAGYNQINFDFPKLTLPTNNSINLNGSTYGNTTTFNGNIGNQNVNIRHTNYEGWQAVPIKGLSALGIN